VNTEAREALLALATAVEAAAKACRTLADTMEAEPIPTCGDIAHGYDEAPCVLPPNHTGTHFDRNGMNW
jgi:hypothetical protein